MNTRFSRGRLGGLRWVGVVRERGLVLEAASGLNPEDAAVASDLHAMVRRMIDALPEELRQPLALSSVEEMNSREIAAVMGIPEGTVRTRLVRARQMLKLKLPRHL